MIIGIIKNGTMSPVNLLIKCNLKYIALLVKYSCQKVEPECNQRFRTNIQYTGNEERIKMVSRKKSNIEECSIRGIEEPKNRTQKKNKWQK